MSKEKRVWGTLTLITLNIFLFTYFGVTASSRYVGTALKAIIIIGGWLFLTIWGTKWSLAKESVA